MMTLNELKTILKTIPDLNAGDSVRINHKSPHCSGSSKSLKIWKNTDGSISCRCFRCGDWGKTKPSKMARVINITSAKTPKRYVETVKLPADITNCMGIHQRIWLKKYDITDEELKENSILYSPSRNSIVIPITGISGELYGYQERHFNTGMPKYTTTSTYKKKLWWRSSHTSSIKSSNTLVVVEDVISGIKVGRVVPAIALLGTYVHDEVLVYARKFDKALIWLDDDNKIVKLKATEIANKFSNLVKNVKVVRTACDPKELDYERIKTIIEKC